MDIETVDLQLSNFSMTKINNINNMTITTSWMLYYDDTNQSMTTNTNGPENCVSMLNRFVAWNHPGNLVSWQTAELIERIKGAILIPVLFFLETQANIVNMIVFYKLGLKERINFCLFFMALLDLLHLTSVFVFQSESMYNFYTGGELYGTLYRFMVNKGFLGFVGFGYGSLVLAAIISTERCVCVLFPFTAQRCVPTKAFAVVVVVIVFTASLLRFVVTRQYIVICVYEPLIQRASLLLTFNAYFDNNRAMLSILDGVFFGICLSAGGPAVVLLSTTTTSIKLWQIVRWRSRTLASTSSTPSSSSSASYMFSAKEIGVTKMLITLSTVFLLLSSPMVILRVSRLIPSFINLDQHANLYRLLSYLTEVCFYCLSIANFIVYYSTGTKYREALHALLGIRGKGAKTSAGSSTRHSALASADSRHGMTAPC